MIKGDIPSLSKSITLIESKLDSDRALAEFLIEKTLPYSGNSFRLGITGVPGVGKSTFIESLGLHLLSKGKKVAVLAVDPSSEISRGSILGDKSRMEKLSVRPGVFIRPTPSGGYLGGVARRTHETILLCEVAGFDFIIVETVGVGQSETAVQHLTDFFLLLMLAGSGDELQGIKRGIMEMADSILITKSDGQNINASKLAKAEFSRALHYFAAGESGWIPRVDVCSALTNAGIEEFYNTLIEFERNQKINNFFGNRRTQQNIYWFESSLSNSLLEIISVSPEIGSLVTKMKKNISDNLISPHLAINTIITEIKKIFVR
ncbi:MAG: methylmalonyl Co-A mutase-associated GTPase MeaB [Bacteroidota bacterium]